MKTKCCNQKIESDQRFCSDCGWEAKVRNEWVQMEFLFMQDLFIAEDKGGSV
jgi:predicted nucleic acid-binding Zn ribbon protein